MHCGRFARLASDANAFCVFGLMMRSLSRSRFMYSAPTLKFTAPSNFDCRRNSWLHCFAYWSVMLTTFGTFRLPLCGSLKYPPGVTGPALKVVVAMYPVPDTFV